MRRSLFVILLVAGLSSVIARAERPLQEASSWVRTADGWQRRTAIAEPREVAKPIHPGLVASFQLGASLLALAAFPARTRPADSRRF